MWPGVHNTAPKHWQWSVKAFIHTVSVCRGRATHNVNPPHLYCVWVLCIVRFTAGNQLLTSPKAPQVWGYRVVPAEERKPPRVRVTASTQVRGNL